MDKLRMKVAAGLTKAKKRAQGLFRRKSQKQPSTQPSLTGEPKKKKKKKSQQQQQQQTQGVDFVQAAHQGAAVPATSTSHAQQFLTAVAGVAQAIRPGCNQRTAELPLGQPLQQPCYWQEAAEEPAFAHEATGRPYGQARGAGLSCKGVAQEPQAAAAGLWSDRMDAPGKPTQDPSWPYDLREPWIWALGSKLSYSRAVEGASPRTEDGPCCCQIAQEPCFEAPEEQTNCGGPAAQLPCGRVLSQSCWPNIIFRQADRTRHRYLTPACGIPMALSEPRCRVGVVFCHWTGSVSYTC